MAGNETLHKAQKAKNDEFYTQFEDIQREINAYMEYDPDVFRGKTVLLPCDDPEWSNFTMFFTLNFESFGLKKLISTSYAADSKRSLYSGDDENYLYSIFDITDFEASSEKYNEEITHSRGKIFTLTKDKNKSGRIKLDDLEWEYLEGDGDFRSEEVKALRDEADIIVTNPPFSLFREFLAWITEANKSFLIIGNQNAITYKEVFPLIKANKMWLGYGFKGGAAHFINKYYTDYAVASDHREGMIRVSGVMWFTNLEHGRRHRPLMLMTEADNIKYSKHKEVRNIGYKKYDNYDAIEVPYTDAIPGDYDGVMGVPVTFLDKYCPEQYEIIAFRKGNDGKDLCINGKCPYFRILIKKK